MDLSKEEYISEQSTIDQQSEEEDEVPIDLSVFDYTEQEPWISDWANTTIKDNVNELKKRKNLKAPNQPPLKKVVKRGTYEWEEYDTQQTQEEPDELNENYGRFTTTHKIREKGNWQPLGVRTDKMKKWEDK